MASADFPRESATLSETDMQAFADGLLPPERAAQVERYLRERPEEARRLAFYGRLNDLMQTRFEAGVASGPAAALGRRHRRAWRIGRLWRWAGVLAVAAGFALVLGLAVVWKIQIPEGRFERAAVDTLAQVNSAGLNERGFALLPSGAQSGPAADVGPDLSPVGFRPVARVSRPVNGIWHVDGVVYRNGQGESAVLLEAPDLRMHDRPQWRARRAGEIRLLMWSRNGVRYILAGRARVRGLMQAADLLTLGAAPAGSSGSGNGRS